MEDYESNTSEKSGPEIKQKMLERHSRDTENSVWFRSTNMT